MNVTREIVKDLLPLYVAGEASAESRAAVEEWLRTDPELARLAEALREDGAPAVALPAGSGQAELATTKSLLRRRSWLLALALFSSALPLSFSFGEGGLRYFMLRDAPYPSAACLVVAAILWVLFAAVSRRLRVTRL
ncbi:MAG: hypothetical protein ABI806_10470 [Candidatus Solibacter sp.]